MEKVGFIGLGIMGGPMAKKLVQGGYDLTVYDIDPTAVQKAVEFGAKKAQLKEIGEQCTVIFTMLPEGKIVQDVLLGKDGILPYLTPGALVIDTSSITPSEAKECAKRLGEKGVGYLDSPVSGGEPGAINGTLAFMVGGSEKDFERARPFFDLMGSSARLVGENGCGCVTKLVNQVIVNLNIAVVSEAFVMAEKSGVDPKKVYEAIRGGLAGSAVLDAKVPMMIERNFRPGGKISINYKDIKNVMNTAHTLDVPMPLTCQLMEIFQSLKVHGYMGEDHSGIVHYFEQLADVQIKKQS